LYPKKRQQGDPTKRKPEQIKIAQEDSNLNSFELI
jgi:hypothetical protein